MTKGVPRPIPPGDVGQIDLQSRARVELNDMRAPEVEWTASGGRRIIATGRVERLDESGTEWNRLLQALYAPGMPQPWSSHPADADLPLTRIVARPIEADPSMAEVRLEWAVPQGGGQEYDTPDETKPPQIEIATTTYETSTQFHIGDDGISRQIFVYGLNDAGEVDPTKKQVGEVKYYQPSTIFRYRRREWWERRTGALAGWTIGDIALHFVGTINETSVFNDAQDIWLITGIQAESNDRGLTYSVLYELQRNRDTWNPVCVYRDPETGEIIDIPSAALPQGQIPPAGTVSPIVRARIYRRRNFYNLELTV